MYNHRSHPQAEARARSLAASEESLRDQLARERQRRAPLGGGWLNFGGCLGGPGAADADAGAGVPAQPVPAPPRR
jgi:hypothetical protein